jgi:hypothetical protein
MKIRIDGHLEWDASAESFLRKRNLETGGSVQRYIDSTVLRLTEPYVPFRTGALVRSGQVHTVVGSGTIKYVTPYAAKLYYSPQIKFNPSFHPLAGAYWFQRMKADRTPEILEGAKRIAGSK